MSNFPVRRMFSIQIVKIYELFIEKHRTAN